VRSGRSEAGLKAMQLAPGKPLPRRDHRGASPKPAGVARLAGLRPRRGLPSVINVVTVSRTSPAPGAHVWSFDGDGGFKALRLPPGADLLLRALQLSSHSAEDPFSSPSRLPSSSAIGSRSLGRSGGLSPASGDFTLTASCRSSNASRRYGRGAAAARVLCVRRVDTDGALSR